MHTDEASPIISWRQHVWTLPAPALLRNWDRSLECWLIANKRHSSQTNCKLFGAKFADVCANRRWQLSNLIMFLSYSDIKHAFLSAAGDATHHRYFLFFFFLYLLHHDFPSSTQHRDCKPIQLKCVYLRRPINRPRYRSEILSPDRDALYVPNRLHIYPMYQSFRSRRNEGAYEPP